MKNLTLIVCGGRDYKDREHVWLTLDRIDKKRRIGTIVQGAAPGADWHAREWARANARMVSAYHAQWEAYGKAAGPLRNQRMLDEAKPDGVVAFPGGSGTADMVRRAKAAGVTVMDLRVDNRQVDE